MFKKTSVRFVIIGIALALAIMTLSWSVRYYNFSEEKIENLRSKGELGKYQDRILNLGLDLQGGIHVVLEVNVPKLIESLATNKTNQFSNVLDAAKKEYNESDAGFFSIFEKHVENKNLKLVRFFNDRGYKNSEIISRLEAESKDATNRAMAVIRNRVDQFGVSEPTIQKAGTYRIIVELAGVTDPERAKQLIQKTALLEFILLKDPLVTQSFISAVDDYLKTGTAKIASLDTSALEDSTVALKESKNKSMNINELLGTSEDTSVIASGESDENNVVVDEKLFADKPFSSLLRNLGDMIGVPEDNLYAVKKILKDSSVVKLLPYDSQIVWGAKPEIRTLNDGTTRSYYLLYHLKRDTDLHGKYITNANANVGGAGSNAGQPVINFQLNNEGSRKFSRLTGANINKRLAIVLDKKVYMAPNIRSKIPNGSGVIEGFANMAESKDIAIVLRAGALPAPIDVIEERSVGPTLGRDSIELGTKLGVIGFIFVVVFMVIYYKGSGLLADIALLMNLLFVLAILAALKATLTLPGIAGLILTIGIAVDNNVLVFERIREELDKGKTVKSSIDSGYGKAFVTILDANITTIFTALILMQFGTGPVKGFAITLLWGVVASFFTAIFVTRTIYNYRTEHKILEKLSI